MCGRYSLTHGAKAIRDVFGVDAPSELLWPRYNIAPTQPVLAVRTNPHKKDIREAVGLHWGLVPPWADDVSIGNRLINCRSETAAEKNAFKHAYRRRRCLLPCSGFYEWKKLNSKTKQPYYIQMADEQPFGLAGLWEHWQDAHGNELESCTILTTSPNALMADLHDRMPVIIDIMHHARWLDAELQDYDAIAKMVGPYPRELMMAHPVSTLVNSPKHDSPENIKEVPPLLPEDLKSGSSRKKKGDDGPALF